MRELLTQLSKPLHQQAYDEANQYKQRLDKCIDQHSEALNEIGKLREQIIAAKRQETPLKSPIDEFLGSKYRPLPNIAYKQKRGNKKEGYYAVWLNQMITPDSWAVQNFKQRVVSKPGNVWVDIVTLGDALAKHTTWVDEQKLYDTSDYYLYPEETLTFMREKCDCEDVSYTMASFMPKLMGVCYGFFIQSPKVKFGHAYPVFLYEGKLYIIETTGNSVEAVPFEDKRYDTYFIVTKEATYEVKGGVSFGLLASWD